MNVQTAPDASHATCGSGDRVGLSSAHCLDGHHVNSIGLWGKKSDYWAQNICAGWGTVVARIDFSEHADKTWHLTNSARKDGRSSSHVNSIECCSDLSDLCNKSDVLTETGCTARFNSNTNFAGCSVTGASVSGENCTIVADCSQAHTGRTCIYGHLEEFSAAA